jgi:hypothetical protein
MRSSASRAQMAEIAAVSTGMSVLTELRKLMPLRARARAP